MWSIYIKQGKTIGNNLNYSLQNLDAIIFLGIKKTQFQNQSSLQVYNHITFFAASIYIAMSFVCFIQGVAFINDQF